MNGIDALVDALFVAIEAKKAGRSQDSIEANRRVEHAFVAAVESAMGEVLQKEAQRPSIAFQNAVKKAMNPNRL